MVWNVLALFPCSSDQGGGLMLKWKATWITESREPLGMLPGLPEDLNEKMGFYCPTPRDHEAFVTAA